MARQIISNTLTLALPESSGRVDQYLSVHDRYYSEFYTVSPQRSVTISDIEIEKLFMDIPVDIYGHIEDYSFILYFTHPGRGIPGKFKKPSDKRSGIISISLDRTRDLFARVNTSRNSFHKVLHNFLAKDLASKSWVYHPGRNHARRLADEKLTRKLIDLEKEFDVIKKEKQVDMSQPIQPPMNRPRVSHSQIRRTPENKVKVFVKEITKKRANFECVRCQQKWQDFEPGGSQCPKCKTHLYQVFRGFVEQG